MYAYIYVCMYAHYLTEVSILVTFLQIFNYIFSSDNTKEITL